MTVYETLWEGEIDHDRYRVVELKDRGEPVGVVVEYWDDGAGWCRDRYENGEIDYPESYITATTVLGHVCKRLLSAETNVRLRDDNLLRLFWLQDEVGDLLPELYLASGHALGKEILRKALARLAELEWRRLPEGGGLPEGVTATDVVELVGEHERLSLEMNRSLGTTAGLQPDPNPRVPSTVDSRRH